MKPLFAALLASLLCTQTVSSLYCYTCDKVDDNKKCIIPKKCEDTDRYCLTKYFGGGSGQQITKECSAHCPSMDLDIGLMAFSVKCCDTSFCNTSGAASVKTSVLLLLVGTLAGIFYIVGANL